MGQWQIRVSTIYREGTNLFKMFKIHDKFLENVYFLIILFHMVLNNELSEKVHSGWLIPLNYHWYVVIM